MLVECAVKVESAAVAIFGEGRTGGQQRWRVRNSGRGINSTATVRIQLNSTHLNLRAMMEVEK